MIELENRIDELEAKVRTHEGGADPAQPSMSGSGSMGMDAMGGQMHGSMGKPAPDKPADKKAAGMSNKPTGKPMGKPMENEMGGMGAGSDTGSSSPSGMGGMSDM